MKKAQFFLFAILLAVLFASCQSGKDGKQILSNSDTRKDIMNTIANDSTMHMEMMTAMMNGKMMKDNPNMMSGMMNNMMEMCMSDTTMMRGMCKTMMANPQMMEMMNKMKEGNMGMDKMKAMDTTKNMDHNMHH